MSTTQRHPKSVRSCPRRHLQLLCFVSISFGLVNGCALKRRVLVTTTPPNAKISINGMEKGEAPCETTLSFDGGTTYAVRASAEQHKDAAKTLVLKDAKAAGDPWKIHLKLDEVEFVKTRLRYYEASGVGLAVGERVVLAAVNEIEKDPKVKAVTRMTDLPPGKLMQTRIWAMSNPERIIYGLPYQREGDDTVYFNLWRQQGMGATRMTDELKVDLDASITYDDASIYFAANRLSPEKFNLWRTSFRGRGGFTKITDSPSSIVDCEPSLSHDLSRIVYTSWLKNATHPQIWTANPDGTMPTQLRIGMHPAWSPDSTQIAYVAEVEGYRQIWVMNADGSNPTQLTRGNNDHEYPVWTVKGLHIIYVSNQAKNSEGQPNYDIWKMAKDGSRRTQLTVNGSYDSRPAVSPDGRYVYFISNRGAKREFDDNWQIWRMELD